MLNALKTLELLVEELDTFSGSEKQKTLFLFGQESKQLGSIFEIDYWHPFKNISHSLKSADLNVLEKPCGEYTVVLILPGKSKLETLYSFGQAFQIVKDGGWVLVAMDNKLGASRYEKEFHALAGEVVSFSKNRARAFGAQKTSALNQEVFQEFVELGKPVEIEGTGFVTVPGIFSEVAVDEGSEYLVKHLPKSLRGSVADFGAGWGYLSSRVLEAKGKLRDLHLYELDLRALECAKINVHSDSVDVHFHWADLTAGVDKRFDTILMNPPFHQGREMKLGLGRDFIQVASQALKPQGELWMVANRQLPYEDSLDELGLRWRIIDQGPRYKIIQARKVARL